MGDGGPGSCAIGMAEQRFAEKCGEIRPIDFAREFSTLPAPCPELIPMLPSMHGIEPKASRSCEAVTRRTGSGCHLGPVTPGMPVAVVKLHMRESDGGGHRTVRHPLGAGCIKRPAADARTMLSLRQAGRDDNAPKLRWHQRASAVPAIEVAPNAKKPGPTPKGRTGPDDFRCALSGIRSNDRPRAEAVAASRRRGRHPEWGAPCGRRCSSTQRDRSQKRRPFRRG